ncbi:unnamed protein product [Arctogadus glacialis]
MASGGERSAISPRLRSETLRVCCLRDEGHHTAEERRTEVQTTLLLSVTDALSSMRARGQRGSVGLPPEDIPREYHISTLSKTMNTYTYRNPGNLLVCECEHECVNE